MTATTAYAAAAPPAMSRAQLRSIRDSGADLNLWTGSIRSGKTIASLVRWLMFVATAPRGGELVMVGRTRQAIARNLFGPLKDPTLFGELTKLISYTSGADTASILGRKVWVIGASDVRAEAVIRGMTIAGAYVDEATLLAEDFWQQLVGRMSVRGAKLFATTNPDAPGHWLKRDVIDGKTDGLTTAVFQFRLDDNTSLDPAWVAKMKRQYTGVWHRRFIEGEWTVADGAIYDMWDPDRHVITRERADALQLQAVLGVGIDHGTTNPTRGILVGVTAEVRGQGPARLVALDEWAPPTGKDNGYQAASYVRWLRQQPSGDRARPQWHVVDPAAAGFKASLRPVLHKASQYGSVVNGTNAVVPGIRTVASLLAADQLVVSDRCTNLIREAPGYAWDPKATKRGEDAPIKERDHELDALRYVVHTLRRSWEDMVPLAARLESDDPGPLDLSDAA